MLNHCRLLATVLCFLSITLAARADLFRVMISTRTYSLNGNGEVTLRVGNQRQFIDLAAQNSSVDPKTLVLAYDTVADALEVVRKSDGSLISTVMSFSGGLNIENAGETRSYRQAFITLPGSNVANGSVDGFIRISFDGQDNISAYHWEGDFQYNIPGNVTTPNRVVHGRFLIKEDVNQKALP